MEIKSVAVLGAGAVGSYVIWGLSGLKNIELGVVAEGERAKRLKERDARLIIPFTILMCGHRRKLME